jgi:glycosyltransferase involved in cell wall biosynthesis
MAKTSILLPVYNGQDYISESIKSVLTQDVDFELLIQDDTSTDATAEICNGFTDSRISYVRNMRNLGCWGSLQAAAERATGSLIRLFSHDDLMLDGDLRMAEECLDANPNYGVAISDYEKIDSKGALIGSSLDSRELHNELPTHIRGAEAAWYLFQMGCISGTQSTITVRRSLFDSSGGFDPSMRFCGDFAFLASCVPKGGLVYNHRLTAKIRFHEQQTSKDGRKHIAYLNEMNEVLKVLVQQMDIRRKGDAKRAFKRIYGHQFFDLGLKRLINGDPKFLREFLSNSGVGPVIESGIEWASRVPRRTFVRKR